MAIISMVGLNEIPVSLLKLGDNLFSLNAGFEKGYFNRYVSSAYICYVDGHIRLIACDISDKKIQYEVELGSSMIKKFFPDKVKLKEVGI